MTSQDGIHEPTVRAAHQHPLPRRDRALLVAWLLPPAAWSLHLVLSYGLVYPALRARTLSALVAVTVGCLALSLLGAGLARWAVESTPEASDPTEESAEQALREARRRTRAERVAFGRLAGELLGLFFALVIFAQALPLGLLGLEGR
jgi:hypothetical protein